MLKVKVSSRPAIDQRVIFNCPNCGELGVIIVVSAPSCDQCDWPLPDILGIVKSKSERGNYHWRGKIFSGNKND